MPDSCRREWSERAAERSVSPHHLERAWTRLVLQRSLIQIIVSLRERGRGAGGWELTDMWRALIALASVMVAATAALAQAYPERPITLINPYAAGGPADVLARTVAEGMGSILGKPVVVESRPGAGTAIAAASSRGHSRTVTRC